MNYTVSELINLAGKCSKRIDFYRADGAAYQAKKFGILEECFKIIEKKYIDDFENALKTTRSKTEFRIKYPEYNYFFYKNRSKYNSYFISQKFSTPQLICKEIIDNIFNCKSEYNNRNILDNNRELDIYIREHKIACEYDSYYWHKNRMKEDNQKHRECNKKGILLIRIKEPTKDYYNNLNKTINNIKDQFKLYIDSINLHGNYSIDDSLIDNITVNIDSIFDSLYSDEIIKRAIDNCDNYADFRKKYNTIYQFLLKNNLLNRLDSLKERDHRHMSRESYIKMILSECNSYKEFIRHKTYSFAYARGYTKEIKSIFYSSSLEDVH